MRACRGLPWLATLLVCAVSACGDNADAWRAGLVAVPEVRLELREAADAEKLRLLRQRAEAGLARATTTRQTAAQLYLELGRQYMAHEIYDAAESCFINVVALEPTQRGAHYLLGALRQLDGRPDAAESPLQQALALAPNDGHTRLRLGDIALMRGDVDSARAHFSVALADPGSALAARAGIGRSAVLAGDHDTAIRELGAVLAEQPGADALRHPLAQALRDRGDIDAARAELARAGSTPLALDDPMLAALSALVTGARSLLVRARRVREAGDLDAALDQYRQALAVDPDFSLAHYGVGQVQVARGAFDLAAAAFARAVEADPSFVEGWFDLAAAEQRRDRPAAAQLALERLLAIDPAHIDARLRLAALLHQAGQTEQAVAHLEALLQNDPLHGEALQSLVMLLVNDERHETAATRLADALAAANAPRDRGRVRALAAHAAMRRGAVDVAEQAYRDAVTLDPGLGDAWFNLGQLLARRGATIDALEALGHAARLEPERGSLALAQLQMQLGRWLDARRTLDAAADSADPSHALIEARLELLVAAPDPAARDARLALDLIEDLRRRQPHLRWIELRAYALADLGEFESATALLERLLEAAQANAAPEAVRERLQWAHAEVSAGRPLRLGQPSLPASARAIPER